MRNGFIYNAMTKMWGTEKLPSPSVLDYAHDWTIWLRESDNDTIQSSSWQVEGDLTINAEETQGARTIVWLGDGTIGRTYKVTNTITTVGGRTTSRTFQVKVVSHLSG